MKNLSNLCIMHSIQTIHMFDHFLVDSVRRGNSQPDLAKCHRKWSTRVCLLDWHGTLEISVVSYSSRGDLWYLWGGHMSGVAKALFIPILVCSGWFQWLWRVSVARRCRSNCWLDHLMSLAWGNDPNQRFQLIWNELYSSLRTRIDQLLDSPSIATGMPWSMIILKLDAVWGRVTAACNPISISSVLWSWGEY